MRTWALRRPDGRFWTWDCTWARSRENIWLGDAHMTMMAAERIPQFKDVGAKAVNLEDLDEGRSFVTL